VPVEELHPASTTLVHQNMHTLSNYSDQPLILLIEEEIQVLQNLASTLNAAGYATRTCSTAEEAYSAMREIRPNLIICDVVVHAQGGSEICEQIKRETDPGDIPVMFLSANQIPDIIRRRGPLGGSYYFRKPIDPSVLLDLLEKTLDSIRPLAMSQG
jgi:CheY-like chemotaxis protein